MSERGRARLPPFKVSHALSSSFRCGGGFCGQQPLPGSAGAVSVWLRFRPGPGAVSWGSSSSGFPDRRPSSNEYMKTFRRETDRAVCPHSGPRPRGRGNVWCCSAVPLTAGTRQSSLHVVDGGRKC